MLCPRSATGIGACVRAASTAVIHLAAYTFDLAAFASARCTCAEEQWQWAKTNKHWWWHDSWRRSISLTPAVGSSGLQLWRIVSVDGGPLVPGATVTLHTLLNTVGQVLQEHGVILFLGDQVRPGLQQRITPGMTISIHRSVPVEIQVDGRAIHTRTRAEGSTT